MCNSRFFSVLVAGLLCLCGTDISAQNTPSSQRFGGPEAPVPSSQAIADSVDSPVTITVDVDGSVNPERIPDEVAYLHFFGVLAKNPDADQALEQSRRVAYLRYFFKRECGPARNEDRSLSEVQIQRLLAAADGVAQRLTAAESRLGVAGGRSGESTPWQQRQEIVVATINSLDSSVDPDAAAKIRRHIAEHVKRRIQLLTFTMPMPAAK